MIFNNQCKVLVSTFPYGQNVIKCRLYSFTMCAKVHFLPVSLLMQSLVFPMLQCW